MIPFIDLKQQYSLIEEEIDKRIKDVLSHGQYIMGPEVEELEHTLASYTQSKYCISCASGTEALLISLMSLGIGKGDEVITTPFTFIATAEVIALLGAQPVFVDVKESTCNLDPLLIEEKITNRTKAIIPVSLYGQPADMDEINAIANKYSISVIEDAAQSFGSEYKGKKSCNLSTVGCTSFFPSKPLGCYGDGGAIFTNEEEIAQLCRTIRVHGQSKRYFHENIGVGGRMDTIQCAVLLAKWPLFSSEVKKRQEIGSKYNEAFKKIGIESVLQEKDRTSVYAQYTIFSDQREELIGYLKDLKIPTAIHYPMPLNKQPAYKEMCSNLTPNSDSVSKKVLSLPMSPYLNALDQERIIEAFKELKVS